jgi:hypothetical protein
MEIQVSNKNLKEMSPQEIAAEIKELSDISGKILIENRDKTYPINVENTKGLNALIKHVERANWSHNTAAALIALVMDIKDQKNKIDEAGNIHVRTANVSSLYQTMLKYTGSGFYEAKEHIQILATVGESISDAMEDVTKDNNTLREIHTRLSSLDDEMQLHTSEPLDSTEVEVESEVVAE